MYNLLSVQLRDPQGGKPLQLRKQGIIPGVLFAKGEESLSLQMGQRDLRKILDQGAKVFEIEVAGGEKHLVNLGQLQKDPVNHNVLHVSFQKLKKGQATQVTVPIRFEGTAMGAATGGVVRQLLTEIMVTGLPREIPEAIVVDISSLDVGGMLNVGKIPLDSKLKFDEGDLEKAVASCAVPKVVEEPVAAAAEEGEGEAAEAKEGAQESAAEKSEEAKKEE